jgi:hypothetical protein
MRQEPEHFGEEELALVYIGKRVGDATKLEALLTEAGVDYALELDEYVGGIIFVKSRTGVFFYVRPADQARVEQLMKAGGFAVHEEPR